MKNRRLLLAVGAFVVLVSLWFWFRPEKLFTNKAVSEAAPSDVQVESEQPLFTGRFEGDPQKVAGRASVFSSADGNKILRLTDFKASSGPEVDIVLVSGAKVPPEKDFSLDAKTGVDLGTLKASDSDQSYAIPPGTDLTHYDIVEIYAVPLRQSLGTARLEPF